MGLDTLELVMSVEETFGIRIDDNDAAQIRTPGMLAEYVVTRLLAARSGRCRSQMRFHRLRAALMKTWETPRRQIRPATPLAELLPQDERLPERWARLSAALEKTCVFPDPEYPPGMARLRSAIQYAPWLLLLGIAVLYAAGERSSLPFLLALLLALFAAPALMERHTWHKRTRIPKEIRTVADMLPYVHVPPSDIPWLRERILEEVLMLTSEHSRVPRHKIRANSRFIEDLDMG